MVNIGFVRSFPSFDMVPGMVQDGSDMVPQRLDLTGTCYLRGFAMVPRVAHNGSGMVPKLCDFTRTFVQWFRHGSTTPCCQDLEKSFLFVRWRFFLKAAHGNYTNYIEK